MVRRESCPKPVVIEVHGRGAAAQGAMMELERGRVAIALQRLGRLMANPESTEEVHVRILT